MRPIQTRFPSPGEGSRKSRRCIGVAFNQFSSYAVVRQEFGDKPDQYEKSGYDDNRDEFARHNFLRKSDCQSIRGCVFDSGCTYF